MCFALDLVAQGIEERGLESREGVVELALDMRMGKGEGIRIALFGQFVDHGAARVGQSHHFGTLIEGFACGVVDGGADDLHLEG